MSALTVLALAAAALITLAGAQKLLDPTMAVGALRALRLPSSPRLVRAGASAELALGVVAVTVGGALTWWLVSLSYATFGAFVVAALRKGTMIGSCGCFGREDTPPHWTHVAANVALAAVAATATRIDGSLMTRLADDPLRSVAIIGLAALAAYLLYALFARGPAATRARAR